MDLSSTKHNPNTAKLIKHHPPPCFRWVLSLAATVSHQNVSHNYFMPVVVSCNSLQYQVILDVWVCSEVTSTPSSLRWATGWISQRNSNKVRTAMHHHIWRLKSKLHTQFWRLGAKPWHHLALGTHLLVYQLACDGASWGICTPRPWLIIMCWSLVWGDIECLLEQQTPVVRSVLPKWGAQF